MYTSVQYVFNKDGHLSIKVMEKEAKSEGNGSGKNIFKTLMLKNYRQIQIQRSTAHKIAFYLVKTTSRDFALGVYTYFS
jgi:hypothetical protein